MYTRSNTHPDAPGVWITEDGEYEFTRTSRGWEARHRAAFTGSGLIGITRTLNGAFALATRHAVTPVGQWS